MRVKKLSWEKRRDGNMGAYIEALDWTYVVGIADDGAWWGLQGHGAEETGLPDEAAAMAAAQSDFEETVKEMSEVWSSSKINRAEAAALVNRQLEDRGLYKQEAIGDDSFECAHHYGRVELRALLDAIYGPPTSDDELVLPKT